MMVPSILRLRAVRHLHALCAAALACALVAGCAPSQMVQQQANPEYAGKKRFKRVLVVAGAKDDLARRVFEDDAVARLRQRGIEGVPSYSRIPKPGPVDEAQLKRLVAETGVDGVLMSRIVAVDSAALKSGGYTVYVGVGYAGFSGFYNGFWEQVNVPVTTTRGPSTIVSETRLFDARTGTLAWTGTLDTTDRDRSLSANLQQYLGLVFDAMISDGVI